MLNKIDLNGAFATHRHPYESLEVYAESSSSSDILIEGKKEQLRRTQSTGLSVRGIFEGKQIHRTSTCLSKETVAGLIAGENPTALSYEELTQSALPHIYANLFGKIRKLNSPSVLLERFLLRDRITQFEVCRNENTVENGSIEMASVEFHWRCPQLPGAPLKVDRYAKASRELLEEECLSEGFLRNRIAHLETQKAFWPAPTGDLSVFWSARATAQLIFPLLRVFEGDLVVQERSFLTRLEQALPFKFSIEDRSEGFDHEGTPKISLPLLVGGKPRALALDRQLAEQMGVPSTGHCRRESYLNQPTVALWQAHVLPDESQDSLLSTLEQGLAVDEVEVERFDPLTGSVAVCLKEVALIHHGERGEICEPIRWRGQLIDLIASLSAFDGEAQKFGFVYPKKRQQILTEVVAPASKSDHLTVQGSVPLNHYW